MTSRAYGARSPRSHYDVILSMTSLATELATPTVTDTLQHLIYKDYMQNVLQSAARPVLS